MNFIRKIALPCGIAVESGVRQRVQQILACLTDEERATLLNLVGKVVSAFIPVPDNSRDLSKGREGDGDRSWSAPSGAYVTTLGIHQSAWILKRLHESSSGKCEFTLDFQRWPPPNHQHILFCWEAFVSGAAHSKRLGDTATAVTHSDQHQRDAATAAVFLFNNECNLQEVNAVKVENRISLIGAVALWSGWTCDLAYLHKTTLVLKPSSVFEGKIQAVS